MTWRRNNAPQQTLSSRAARGRPDMTSGEATREHLGQLTAVGPARAPSPGNRLPLWRALGERTWMRGQQWRSGKARHPRRRRRRSWGGGGKVSEEGPTTLIGTRLLQLNRSAKPVRARRRRRSCQRPQGRQHSRKYTGRGRLRGQKGQEKRLRAWAWSSGCVP